MRRDFKLVANECVVSVKFLIVSQTTTTREVGVSLRQINAGGSESMNITRMTHAGAPSGLVVEPLQRNQPRSVFVLMRFALPALSLQKWLRFGRPLTVGAGLPNRSVLVVRLASHRHPLGAVCFRRHMELNHPGVLVGVLPSTGHILVGATFVRPL